MKQCITTMFVIAAMTISMQLRAQMDYYPVPWSIWLYDEETGESISNTGIDATIRYLDEGGNTLFMEGHTGLSNKYGHFVFKVGKGFPLSGTLNAALYKSIVRFAYTLNFVYKGENRLVESDQEVCAAGKANAALFACDAGNAFGFGGFIFIFQAINFGSIVCPDDDDDYEYYAMINRKDPNGLLRDETVMTPITNLVRMRQAQHVENLQLIRFLSIGLGLGKPIYCGPDPSTIYGMHGITMPNLMGLRYGVDLRVQHEKVTNSTYTLNCENANNGGYGLRALGANGTVGYGNNGHVGVTYGNNNGTGVYGVVSDPPGGGMTDFKYGVAATSGGFTPNSYAGIFFGPLAGSEAMMVFSDRNLKKNVHPAVDALEKINHLRPSTYEYLDDSPYNFSKGTHYGFIAQEMESMFPELVKEVVLPKSLDVDKFSTSGGVPYKAINYVGLIPVLTASIQELDAKVVRLESKLAALNTIVEELKEQIETISDKK